MPKQKAEKATTLSISLPPELARAVNQRVSHGFYGSASELVREALRLLLRQAGVPGEADGARPLDVVDLHQAGAGLKEQLPAAVKQRLLALDRDEQLGPGLRDAPERLARLKRVPGA